MRIKDYYADGSVRTKEFNIGDKVRDKDGGEWSVEGFDKSPRQVTLLKLRRLNERGFLTGTTTLFRPREVEVVQ